MLGSSIEFIHETRCHIPIRLPNRRRSKLVAGDHFPVDVVISNGVINLCADKYQVFREIFRTLKPGGRLHLADIVVHKEVPGPAKGEVDLWTA